MMKVLTFKRTKHSDVSIVAVMNQSNGKAESTEKQLLFDEERDRETKTKQYYTATRHHHIIAFH